MTDVPTDVLGDSQKSLQVKLEAEGFRVMQETYDPQAFGNCLIDLSTPKFSVRILRDRGIWSLEASVPGWKEWMPVSMWRWTYEGGDLPGAISNFEEDAEWLLRSLGTIVADLREDEAAIHERLWECGRARLAAMIERTRPPEEAS